MCTDLWSLIQIQRLGIPLATSPISLQENLTIRGRCNIGGECEHKQIKAAKHGRRQHRILRFPRN